MKILNLYAGIGGNRKFWKNVEVTAVENNEQIAKIYQDFFPKDRVIVADAHQYLLDHYKEFDFIWSSPPCPTHSDFRRCRVHRGLSEAVYPNMELYQEIILLKHFALKKTKWIVENVKPYYELLIKANKLHRHLFWSNFSITRFDNPDDRKHENILGTSTVYGFNLKKYRVDYDKQKQQSYLKRKILRNMVNPKLGLHILKCAYPKEVKLPKGFIKQETLYVK